MFYLYEIRNNLDGKIYIGITNNPKKRWQEHKNIAKTGCRKREYIHLAIQKHGVENFTFEVMNEFDTKEQALDTEKFTIKQLKEKSIDIYNLTDGGEGAWGRKYTEEQALKTKETKIRKGTLKFTFEIIEQIRSLYKTENYSYKELGIIFNTNPSSIARIINNRRWKTNEPEKSIIRRKLLTEEKVIEIINTYNLGTYKQIEIENMFNMKPGHLRKILQGKIWKSLNYLVNKSVLKQNAKVPNNIKLEMFNLYYKNSYSYKELAALYNLTYSYVAHLINKMIKQNYNQQIAPSEAS